MDQSETYIKMRLAAIPDLGMGIPPLEPYHFKRGVPSFAETIWVDAKGDWYHFTEHEACQLERQDQLQEMVGAKDNTYLWLAFEKFMNPPPPFFPNKKRGLLSWCPTVFYSSMEQLWLAFVMKEKYNKTWDGEKWI